MKINLNNVCILGAENIIAINLYAANTSVVIRTTDNIWKGIVLDNTISAIDLNEGTVLDQDINLYALNEIANASRVFELNQIDNKKLN